MQIFSFSFPGVLGSIVSERGRFLILQKAGFIILHVLGYYQHQCSNVRFNLLCMGHLFVLFFFEW